MATIHSMANEVYRKLAGFTLRQDRQTHLSTSIDASVVSIVLASGSNISTGIIQIEDELIYIDSYNKTTGTASIPPYGRGYNNTIADAHAAGTKVVITPTFPNVDIKTAINETILAVGTDLFATGNATFNYVPARATYSLPNDTIDILSVSYESIGPSKEWVPIRNYRIDNMAYGPSFNNSNATITIYSEVSPGRKVNVFYTKIPTILTDGDDFTLTGLPGSCKDVIILGAAAMLSSFIDPGRLTYASAESDQQSQVAGRSYGSGTNTSKYLWSLYNQRRQEEAFKFNNKYPIRIHHTR